ncbi:MAG: glycoside hydrolase family 3 C-terminal domain-containing protein [Alistipes sp.]|nr:glycoside hydrolase family 3 C-terminal domain-containing protein [Alistipes sp.]
MRRTVLTLLSVALFVGSATAQTKYQKRDKGDFIEITQQGGRTIGYSQNSGIKILTVDGFAFKDLNRNGKLDKYEDWRLPSEERAKDLASQLSLEEIAGLMLYSSSQLIPTYDAKAKKGTYRGKPFSKSYASPSDLTDQQLKFLVEDKVRHILISKVNSPYISAQWNNKVQALCEGLDHGIPANNSSDPRHGVVADEEFAAGVGGKISIWPGLLGMAATFDPAVALRFGEVASIEYRALGIATALSPQIDLATEPRWRRAMMTFGEGSKLATDIARAYSDGFQTSKGKDVLEGAWGTNSVNAMVKHWPGGGTGEAGRDAHFSFGKYAVYPGKNFEEHLLPFTEGAFKLQGGTEQASAVMPYYTISYDVDPSGANVANGYSDYIIKDLLRTKYNYKGVICTDWGIVNEYKNLHRNTGKPWGLETMPVAERYLKVLMAGVDQYGGVNTTKHIIEAYELGKQKYGEKAIRARFEESAVRLLLNIFRTGLFENSYLEPAKSQATVGCVEYMNEGFAAQLKSVVMLKNHAQTLPLKGQLKVYVPKRTYNGVYNQWYDRINGEPYESYGISLNLVKKYFDVVDNPADADVALVFIQGPTVDRGHHITDIEAGGNGYTPISLQYGDYTAKYARKQSIAGGDPKENFTNRSYYGKKVITHNKVEMETVLETRKLMGKKPVIVAVAAERPMCFHEIEKSADAILIGFEVQNQAFMEIIAGKAEPQGLLPMQMPKDMRTVEENKEDVPFDLKCYKDADGNVYDYAYGLNWSGVIKDWRTERYAPKKK